MQYSLDQIARILHISGLYPNRAVRELLIDSRRLSTPEDTLFFALTGERRDGHQFIGDLYASGVRSFMVQSMPPVSSFPDASFLLVPDTRAALQQLASWHRAQFKIPVLGITGSNGKTIVKEWLFQCLWPDRRVVRSPRSYNSQIGVPLSVWQMNETHEIGIFEAGISQPGEMAALEQVIRPDIGILTNMGDAHSEGFSSQEEKLREKLQLFRHCAVLIGPEKDLGLLRTETFFDTPGPTLITWSREGGGADWTLKSLLRERQQSILTLCAGAKEFTITIPFTDDAAVDNAITCFIVLLQMGLTPELIIARLQELSPVDMRLQLLHGINHCTIINDSYSADLHSLEVALGFMQQQAASGRKTLIISDLLQNLRDAAQIYPAVLRLARQHQVQRLMVIGEQWVRYFSDTASQAEWKDLHVYADTSDFLRQFRSHWFRDEMILVKGARVFGFEQIVAHLELKAHQTVLEINLNAIAQNVKAYQQMLLPTTKMMAMVKAFAYGSGAEIAGILQYHKVDYLGVAYADEGVELRRAGILLPVMVMNPEASAFESLLEHQLQPVIFSMSLLDAWERFLEKEGQSRYPVHIEIETGMHRLGFSSSEWKTLAQRLAGSSALRVQSVFSHLAASEDPGEDDYTRWQFEQYQRAVNQLQQQLPYSFLRHIANTAAIARHPELQLDMVRLGIGMYGIDSAERMQKKLSPAATLRSTIAQLSTLQAGETVGYNRRGKMDRTRRIATVRIGYADGFPRSLGQGRGEVLIRGQRAPVVGSVCMDMTMVDVTEILGVQEGDDVILFGRDLPIQDMAAKAGTIPYEIMTGISQRVNRVYYEE